MSRSKKLLSRPELPSLDEIIKDLDSAPSDDVAFTFLQNYTSGSGTGAELPTGSKQMMDAVSRSRASTGESARISVDTSKSFESAAKRPRQENSKQKSEEHHGQSKEESDIQDCYQKVLGFLEMNSYLRDSQDKMTQQCTDLQELGQSVKDQIDSLRTRLHPS
ncbi:uncharacterized protein LOC115920751 [Strongylocentrotus purpuratus]|uniref:Uncharacterized protein n=1 Tax=Strongylocentrotus purpuratus TaxID=7668 RepID=A0A7M7N9J1_STRPU|nr:uncharacterized protein LOC115920751 [Strongylocentrotus purpuratus]